MNKRQMFDLAIDNLKLFRQIRQIDKESAAVVEMGASIAEIGLQQPVTVRPLGDGNYGLIDGETRYWAHILLKRTSIPVIVEEGDLGESDVIQRQLIPNCHRQDLTPVEKARAIDRLMKLTGWSASEVALKLAMSVASVCRSTSILMLTDEVLARVEAGELPASAAYELTKVTDPVQQALLASKAAKGGLTRDALSGAIKAAKKSSTAAAPERTSRVVARLPGNRSVTVAAPSLTVETLCECLEELLVKARQARTKGIVVQTFAKVLTDQSRQTLKGDQS